MGWGQRSGSGVVPQELPSLFHETEVLRSTSGSVIRLGWQASEPQGPACLHLPSFSVIGTHHHAWLCVGGLGVELRSSCLSGKRLTD